MAGFGSGIFSLCVHWRLHRQSMVLAGGDGRFRWGGLGGDPPGTVTVPLKMAGLEFFLPLQSWACQQFGSAVAGHLITGLKQRGQFTTDRSLQSTKTTSPCYKFLDSGICHGNRKHTNTAGLLGSSLSIPRGLSCLPAQSAALCHFAGERKVCSIFIDGPF